MDCNKQDNLISKLMSETGLSSTIVNLLVERGFIDKISIDKFLHPSLQDLHSPFDIINMRPAIELIRRHLDNNSNILIFGDYDCDGVGAAAIMYLALDSLGGNVQSFIPTRHDDGYGLSKGAINKVVENFKPNLIITVDCGISSVKEVAYVKSLGIDIIVTDHHEPQEELPDCLLVDPKLQDDDYPQLCGAGVALKVVEALTDLDNAMQYVDICAISTIADLVPLTSDNRIIAHFGLMRLNKTNKLAPRQGLNMLKEISKVKPNNATAYDIGFKLAPRINASGRLSNAQKSFDLLTSTDSFLVRRIVEELDAENKHRQELCQSIAVEAESLMLDYDVSGSRIIVLFDKTWEGGVVGIASAKLTQYYRRPTILFTELDGVLKGSARSIEGINIHTVLTACKDDLIQFGGHSMAAGMTIKPENLDKFIAHANEYIINNYDKSLFLPYNKNDGKLSLDNIDMPFVETLKLFEPFGMGNHKPVFYDRCEDLPFQRIGSHNHIKCKIRQNMEIIAFGSYDIIDTMRGVMPKNIYYNLDIEEFNNRKYIKAFLKDVELLDILPSKWELAHRYFAKYLCSVDSFNKNNLYVGSVNEMFGHLIICFSLRTFRKLKKQYPTYRTEYGVVDSANPYNTILLSPHNSITFGTYGKVDLYDNPPPPFVKYIMSYFGNNVNILPQEETNEDWDLGEITIEMMRAIFVFLRSTFNGKRVGDINELFQEFKKCKINQTQAQFVTIYNIFREMQVVYFVQNSIMVVNSRSVDLTKSIVYKAVKDYARNIR